MVNKIRVREWRDDLMDLNQESMREIPENPGIQPEAPPPPPPTQAEDAAARFMRVVTRVPIKRPPEVAASNQAPGPRFMKHKPAPPPETVFPATAAALLERMNTGADDDDFVDPLALLLKPAAPPGDHDVEEYGYDDEED